MCVMLSNDEIVESSEPAEISKRRTGVGAPLVCVWAAGEVSGDCARVTCVAPNAVYAINVPIATNRYVTGHFEVTGFFLLVR
jgi:hypothetical protein